jgi:hypothetical protein
MRDGAEGELMTDQVPGAGETGDAASADADPGDAAADDTIEVAGGVAAAGRRAINEDWAATILGLVLLALVLTGVIGKGVIP